MEVLGSNHPVPAFKVRCCHVIPSPDVQGQPACITSIIRTMQAWPVGDLAPVVLSRDTFTQAIVSTSCRPTVHWLADHLQQTVQFFATYPVHTEIYTRMRSFLIVVTSHDANFGSTSTSVVVAWQRISRLW